MSRTSFIIGALVLAVSCCAAEQRPRRPVFPYETIVLSAQAGEVERTAAVDLQKFVARRYGSSLPIVRSRSTRGRAILMRVAADAFSPPPELPRAGESFDIAASGNDLVVTGSDPGAVLQATFQVESELDAGARADAFIHVRRTARFRFRAAMPYFTGPGEVTDEYLRFMASSGYNAIYLEFDPFQQYIQDPIFFPIQQIFRMRDFVNAPNHERLVAYANDVFARAKRYGLDAYLYVMEPWGGDWQFVRQHPDVVCRNSVPHLTNPLCLKSGAARDYLRDLTAQLARHVPDLKGIIVMTEDGTTICDMSCPVESGQRSERLSNQARAQQRALLFHTLAEGAKSVRLDFRIVAYTWWWTPEDYAVVIPQLPKNSLICTRTSTHAAFALGPDWQGTPADVSLLVDGPGRDFEDAVKYAREAGIEVVDMLAISNGHELITLPAISAPDRYGRKLDVLQRAGGAGWVGYDCGGLTHNLAARIMGQALWWPAASVQDQVAELAKKTFGEQGAAKAIEGWTVSSDAWRWFPVELDRTEQAGINNAASISAMAPAVPLSIAQVASYRLFPKGAESAPNENLSQGDWLSFWRNRKVMLKYLPRLRDGLARGVDLLHEAARLAPREKQAAAREEVRTAEASLCTVRSALHLLQFWQDLASIAQARGAGSEAELIQRVNATVAAERQNTRQMLHLVRQDRRLFYCACTAYVHPQYISGGFQASGVLRDDMTIEQILEKKLALMAAENYTDELARVFSGCCVDLIDWAIRQEKDAPKP